MDGDKEVTISEGSVQYHAVNGLEQDPVQSMPVRTCGNMQLAFRLFFFSCTFFLPSLLDSARLAIQRKAISAASSFPDSPKGSIGGFVAPGTQAMGKDMGSQGSHSQHQQEFVEGSVRYFGTSNAPVAGTVTEPNGHQACYSSTEVADQIQFLVLEVKFRVDHAK
jgi:hypothetical protein